MAVPKRKTSPSKRNMRRSHHKLAPASHNECPNCGEPSRLLRELQCQGFIVGERVSDKLLQADGVERAGGHPAGPAVPQAGQHR